MYKPSKKTIYITTAFAAVAGIVGVSSYWNDIAYAVCDKIYPEANDGEVRLKDNQGNRYSLLNHGDGKETALYDDNRSVTFHRDTSGNLVWDAGLAGLLPTSLGRRTYQDYEKRRSQKASSIGQKSGFGSAGSRSGGS